MYIQLNADFQRTAWSNKKAFFNEQCIKLEENNRRGKTRDLFRKIGNIKRIFCPLLLFSSSFIHCSLKKPFLFLLAVLWDSAFSWIYLSLSPLLFTSLLSSAICKAFSDNHFAFLLFFSLGWFCLLLPIQYDELPSMVLQAHC